MKTLGLDGVDTADDAGACADDAAAYDDDESGAGERSFLTYFKFRNCARSNLMVDHQMGKVANQHMLEQRENLEMVLKQVAIDLLHTLNSLRLLTLCGRC